MQLEAKKYGPHVHFVFFHNTTNKPYKYINIYEKPIKKQQLPSLGFTEKHFPSCFPVRVHLCVRAEDRGRGLVEL